MCFSIIMNQCIVFYIWLTAPSQEHTPWIALWIPKIKLLQEKKKNK